MESVKKRSYQDYFTHAGSRRDGPGIVAKQLLFKGNYYDE
jgi:hypothetical protein